MELYTESVSPDLTHRIYAVYRNSDNNYFDDDRHHASSIGHFLLSSYTIEEMQFVWSTLLENEKSFALDYEPVLFRVLKYTPGCYVQPHEDVAKYGDETDHSLIIQLNPTNEFKGGIPTVADKEYRIEQGDALIYQYGERHGVTEVTEGVRYVLNVRMKKIHK
jgi:predicted 2-oxoglutarate/Fe(II)-dependent dioxygenase YbiX